MNARVTVSAVVADTLDISRPGFRDTAIADVQVSLEGEGVHVSVRPWLHPFPQVGDKFIVTIEPEGVA